MNNAEDNSLRDEIPPVRDELSEGSEAHPNAYRQPPKEHRIKKGEIRNPWGRAGKPKPDVEFLEGFVIVTVNGQKKKMTRNEALDEMLFREAMRGSVAATKQLERREEKRRAIKALGGDAEAISPEDDAILDRLLEREIASRLKRRDEQ